MLFLFCRVGVTQKVHARFGLTSLRNCKGRMFLSRFFESGFYYHLWNLFFFFGKTLQFHSLPNIRNISSGHFFCPVPSIYSSESLSIEQGVALPRFFLQCWPLLLHHCTFISFFLWPSVYTAGWLQSSTCLISHLPFTVCDSHCHVDPVITVSSFTFRLASLWFSYLNSC